MIGPFKVTFRYLIGHEYSEQTDFTAAARGLSKCAAEDSGLYRSQLFHDRCAQFGQADR